MFTGIIRAIGTVQDLRGGHLQVVTPELAPGLVPGGSISVNGACLTVTSRDGSTFTADLVPETLARTNLGALEPGQKVNLETPLTLQQPLDGHLVQGHVDATAVVMAVKEMALGCEVTFTLPEALAHLVAEKGSIAVDGISLTVAAVAGESFTVALIPATLGATIAGSYRKGSTVNLEIDVLARYAERQVLASTPKGGE